MEVDKKVVIRQFDQGLIGILSTAGRNFINNFTQSKIPVAVIQTYQNTSQMATVFALTQLNKCKSQNNFINYYVFIKKHKIII